MTLPPKLKETLDRFAAAAGLRSTAEIERRRATKERRIEPVEPATQSPSATRDAANDLHKPTGKKPADNWWRDM